MSPGCCPRCAGWPIKGRRSSGSVIAWTRSPRTADDITVLRNGVHQGTMPLGDRTVADLAELIVGHPVERVTTSSARAEASVLLQVQGLSARRGGPRRSRGATAARSSAWSALPDPVAARSCAPSTGQLPRGAARCVVDGVELRGGPYPGRPRGRGAVPARGTPADRVRGHVGGGERVRARRRALLARIPRPAGRAAGPVRTSSSSSGCARRSADAEPSSLSGGNQQKVLIGAAIRAEADVLLVAGRPTQGVDVGARADIHTLIKGRDPPSAAAPWSSAQISRSWWTCAIGCWFWSAGRIVGAAGRARRFRAGDGQPDGARPRAGGGHSADQPGRRSEGSAMTGTADQEDRVTASGQPESGQRWLGRRFGQRHGSRAARGAVSPNDGRCSSSS